MATVLHLRGFLAKNHHIGNIDRFRRRLPLLVNEKTISTARAHVRTSWARSASLAPSNQISTDSSSKCVRLVYAGPGSGQQSMMSRYLQPLSFLNSGEKEMMEDDLEGASSMKSRS
ncbi:hypothetical protein E1B28_007632 [Marasmius oreades]|uniref:Uncharacterized protein n=1 Tax=Marasmius oreades TaxID=181124 RepID=A0A9P7S3R8_9AGAR|nr:uncharacterized protein E1B28_007632 [Marasmius oreades]KAG7094003.1 hypothetical protein E1B28_007632 [Marasmius oreades]